MRKIFAVFFAALASISLLLSAACASGSGTGTEDSSANKPDSSGGGNTPITAELADKELYIGMFGISPESKQDTMIKFEDAVKGDTYNVFMLSQMSEENMDKYGQMIYDAGKKFWLYGIETVWEWPALTVRRDAYKRLNDLRGMYASKPWYDAFLGLHIDEPLLSGMSLKSLEEGSKAIDFVFPEKRFWVNFGGFAFNEDLPSSRERMTKEAGRYISDISFDLYGEINETILDTWHNMVAMFKGEGKYFWAVPMTMAYAGRSTEENCIEHVKTFYDLVKETTGGAGLLLYTGGTFSWELEQIGNIGYYDLLVSEEEFKTWSARKRPWVMYYERFYDADGNPLNGGFKPWTKLAEEIQTTADDMAELNAQRVEKIDTDVTVAKNAVFEYNGSSQFPVPSPAYLEYEYSFKKKGEEIFSEEPPSEVGEYEATITLKESRFRKKKTVKVSFSIVESTKTLLAEKDITEHYAAGESWISVGRGGLEYSFDGTNYKPYEKDLKIDVSDLITRTEYSNAIWFKEGEKAPYIYAVKRYREVTVFDFEGAAVDQWSTFTLASNRTYVGAQSAYCKGERAVTGEMYLQHFYYNTCNLGISPSSGGYDISSAHYFEFWIYAEEEISSLKIEFSVEGWDGSVVNESKSVPAKVWTKVSFNLGNRSNLDRVKLDRVIMMSLKTEKPVDFYVDNMIAVML